MNLINLFHGNGGHAHRTAGPAALKLADTLEGELEPRPHGWIDQLRTGEMCCSRAMKSFRQHARASHSALGGEAFEGVSPRTSLRDIFGREQFSMLFSPIPQIQKAVLTASQKVDSGQNGLFATSSTLGKGEIEVENTGSPSKPSAKPEQEKPVKTEPVKTKPVDTGPKINIPEEITSLARTGLNSMGDPEYAGRGVKAAEPCVKSILENTDDPTIKKLIEGAQKASSESGAVRFAAYKGALTALTYGSSSTENELFLKAGLVALDSVWKEKLYEESIAIKAATPFMEAIKTGTDDEAMKLLADCATQVTESEFNSSKYAAFKGAFTAMQQGSISKEEALSEAAITALDSVGQEKLYKEAIGVKGAKPFIDAIETQGDNETARLVASIANQLKKTDFDMIRYAAFRGAMTAIKYGTDRPLEQVMAKAGITALDSAPQGNLYKEAIGASASKPFLDAIAEKTDNEKAKLLSNTVGQLEKTDFDMTRYAALRGAFTAISGGLGRSVAEVLAKAGITALDSAPQENLHKEAIGVRASKPFMEAIEKKAEKKKHRLLSKTSNEMEQTDFDMPRYKAFKSTFNEILKGGWF